MTLIVRDCIEALAELDEASVDAVVTDPPYGLGFMGHAWDQPGAPALRGNGRPGTDAKIPAGGAMEGRYDLSTAANRRYQEWSEAWAREALRVLKPGGHLLAFGGTRTYHRLTCALEDAGFEIRDTICWLYGSGFPKSLDVSKAIDKAAGAERPVVGVTRKSVASMGPGEGPFSDDAYEWQAEFERTGPATDDARRWQGWGTALKPAFEPIVVARKPLAGTVAGNVLEWGCGALHIDACRISANGGGGESGSGEALCNDCRDALPDLREADARLAVEAQEGEASADLRTRVPGSDDEPGEQSALEGRALEGRAGLLDRERRGSRADARASSRDGGDHRAPAEAERDGPPSGRGQGEQPSEQPSPDDESGRAHGRAHPQGRLCAGCGRPLSQRLGEASAERRYTERGGTNFAPLPGPRGGDAAGRWPANVVLDEAAAAMLDEQTGERPSRGGRVSDSGMFGMRAQPEVDTGYGDSGGASRFFYCAKASRAERNAGLDGFEERETGKLEDDAYEWATDGKGNPRSAKTRAANVHPTVKPVSLMRWLVRLVTPPGGLVLDPFAGSGTTGIACALEGFRFLGIERDPDYARIAEARIAFWAEHGERGLEIVAERGTAARTREAIAAPGQLSLEATA